MHLHLRPVVVLAALLVGLLICGWGVATSVRPDRWDRTGARWWVGWTREPVRRAHGAALAVVGVGISLAGIAAALTSPAAAIPPYARVVEFVGLGVIVLGGTALLATLPAPPVGVPPGRTMPRRPDEPADLGPIPVGTTIPAPGPEALSPERSAQPALVRSP